MLSEVDAQTQAQELSQVSEGHSACMAFLSTAPCIYAETFVTSVRKMLQERI